MPGTTDTALITLPGSYDVTVSASSDVGVGALSVTAGTLTVNGLLLLNAPAGASAVGSGATLNGTNEIDLTTSTLTNAGVIAVSGTASFFQLFSGTIVNQGTLLASAGTLELNTDAITNLSSGTLSGGSYVVTDGAPSPGANSLIVFIPLSATDARVIDDAATITLNGTDTSLYGYNASTGSLDIVESSLTRVDTAGVLNVLGGRNYVTSNTLTIAGQVGLGGGTLSPGGLSLASGGQVTGFGAVTGALTDGGTISAAGGVLTLTGAVIGAGALAIAGGATLAASGSLAAGLRVGFTAGGAVLALGAPTQASATIFGFALSDTIVAQGFAGNTPVWSAGTLTLTGTGAQLGQTLTLSVAGSYAAAHFSAVPDGSGTDIGVSCFAAGTRILTDRGERAVETLRAGMLVPGRAGTLLRIRWVGHRRIVPGRHAKPQEVQPVRVRADAFGPGLPRRDLRLSPDHAIYLPGPPAALVPVHTLCNGVSVLHENVRAVTYYHVELETEQGEAVHDVLLAEGLATESYLDTGNRAAFVGGGPALALHPEFSRSVWQTRGVAPLHLAGPEVVALRRRLLDRARGFGHARTEDPDLHVRADGARLPARVRSRLHLVVDAPAGELRLVSRTAVPALVRADDTDPRTLGVAVARVTLDGVTLPLDGAAFGAGFYPLEQRAAGGWRWTDGDARLILPRPGRLAVALAMTLPYWVVLPGRGARVAG